MLLGQISSQLPNARTDLEGEVRRRGPDEGVDVVSGPATRRSLMSPPVNVEPSAEAPRAVDVMLLADGRALGAQPDRVASYSSCTASRRSRTRSCATASPRRSSCASVGPRGPEHRPPQRTGGSSPLRTALLFDRTRSRSSTRWRRRPTATVGLILGFAADLRGARLVARARARAARPATVLDRDAIVSFAGVALVAIGAASPRLRRDRRDPVRRDHGGDVGGLLGADRTPDGELLALSRERARAARDGSGPRGRRRAQTPEPGLEPGSRGLAPLRLRRPGPAGADERALVPLALPDRPRRGRPWPPTCSRSWPRSPSP